MADPIIFQLQIDAAQLQTQITEAIKAAGRAAAAKLRILVDTEFIKDQVRAAIAAARTGLPSITAAPPGARVGGPGTGAVVLPSLAAPAVPGTGLPPPLPPGAGVRGAVPIGISAANVSVKGVQPKVAKAIREALRSLLEIKHRPTIRIEPKNVTGARAIQNAVREAVAKLGTLKPKVTIKPDVVVTAITREARIQILQQVRTLLAPLNRPGIATRVTIHPVVRTGKAQVATRALAGSAGALGGVFTGLKNLGVGALTVLAGAGRLAFGALAGGAQLLSLPFKAIGAGLGKISGLLNTSGAIGSRVFGRLVATVPGFSEALGVVRGGIGRVGQAFSLLGGAISSPARAILGFGGVTAKILPSLGGIGTAIGAFGGKIASSVPALGLLGKGFVGVFGGLGNVVKGAAQTIGGIAGVAGKIGGAFVRAGAQITRSLSRILIPPQLAALASFAIPVVGFTGAIVAVKEFAQHQQAILESLTNFTEVLRTLPAGASSVDFLNRSFRSLSNQVTEVAIKFGLSAKSVAQAMFEITSAGVGLRDPTERMEALTAAAKVATGGVADIKESFRGVLGISRSFNVSFERAADVLFAIQRLGIAPVRELAPQIARVSSFAAAAGISLEELAAAIATASGQTVPLSSVITGLRQTFADFAKGGSNVTQSALAELTAKFPGFNLQVNAATIRSKGLTGVLQELSKVDQGLVGQVFRRVRSLGVLLPLIQARARFEKNLTDISGAHGDADLAVGIIQQGLANQITRVVEAARLAAIAIGEKIAAVLDLGKRVTSLTASFTDFGRSIQAIPNEELKRTVADLLSLKGLGQILDFVGRGIISSLEVVGPALFGALKTIFATILTFGKVIGDRLSIIISESISTGLGRKIRGVLGIETPLEEARREVERISKELEFEKVTFTALSGFFEATDKPTRKLRDSVEQSRNQVLGLNRQLNETRSRLKLLERSAGVLDLKEGIEDASKVFAQIRNQLDSADSFFQSIFGGANREGRKFFESLRGGQEKLEDVFRRQVKIGQVSQLFENLEQLGDPIKAVAQVLRSNLVQATDETTGSLKVTVGEVKAMEAAISSLQGLAKGAPFAGLLARGVPELLEAGGPAGVFDALSKSALNAFVILKRLPFERALDPAALLRATPEVRAAFDQLGRSLQDPRRFILDFLRSHEELRGALARELPPPFELRPGTSFVPFFVTSKKLLTQLSPEFGKLAEPLQERLRDAVQELRDFSGVAIDAARKDFPELVKPYELLRQKLEIILRQMVAVKNEVKQTGEAGVGVDTIFIRVARTSETIRAIAEAQGQAMVEAGAEQAALLRGARVTARPTGFFGRLGEDISRFFETAGISKAIVDATAVVGNATNTKLDQANVWLEKIATAVGQVIPGLLPGTAPRGARAIRQSQARAELEALGLHEIFEGAR